MLEATHEHIVVPLNLKAMQEAAKIIEGTHDFKCFEASGSVVKNTVRTVYSVDIQTRELSYASSISDDAKNQHLNGSNPDYIYDSEINIYVTGNGFLYNMVRIIAGTLLYVGIGKLSVDDVRDILEKGDRKKAGKTLSAKGLHLIKVVY